MRILTFVDLHADKAALKELEKAAEGADILVCAGDISIFENHLESTLERLNSLDKPVLMIHGNHENPEVMEKACSARKNIIFMHRHTLVKDDILFILNRFSYGIIKIF